jgi:hypothetical protein
MAMTLKAAPQRLTPAYNPVKYIYDSTNKNLGGFKYIFEVYESGTANQIAEYRVLPVYSTGYGEIDLTKLLQAKVSFDLFPTNTTVYNAPNSYYKYDLKVGEEYLTTTTFTTTMSQYTTAPYGGRVQLNGANTFVVGDQIVLTQTGIGTVNPTLDGLYTVLVATPTFIVINFLWSGITNANKDVDITYADGRKTVTYNIISYLNNYVFNGALPWSEWPSWNQANYNLGSNTDKFLTSIPAANFYATLSQDLWMNAVYGLTGGGPHRIVFTNDGGDVLRKSVTATDYITGNAVGPNNAGTLTVVSGTLPLIKPTTQYYEYYYEHGGLQVTQSYRVNIDRRVQSQEYSIIFLDRYGSWGSFAFTGRVYKKGNVQREQYNMDVKGKISSSQWTYDLIDRGYINSYVTVEKTIDLNTNWMNEEMAQYFTELISSPYTYFKVSNYDESCDIPESTEYVSCNIVTSSYEYYKQRNKNLIKQSITIKLANNDMVNG